MDQPTVLVISDDPAFPAAITGRWQASSSVPVFTLMQGDVCHDLVRNAFDLAMVGDVRQSSLDRVLHALQLAASPVLLVMEPKSDVAVHAANWKTIRKMEGWLDVVFLLGSEMLARRHAEIQLRRMQQAHASLERQAALGRYMLDMRHGLNNALTSVLGNSELLLLDSASYSPAVQLQFETIRNMAIRINEIFQRFTSLEKELKLTQKPSQDPHRRERITSAGM